MDEKEIYEQIIAQMNTKIKESEESNIPYLATK